MPKDMLNKTPNPNPIIVQRTAQRIPPRLRKYASSVGMSEDPVGALVKLLAETASYAAAAERAEVHEDTILNWRKQLHIQVQA